MIMTIMIIITIIIIIIIIIISTIRLEARAGLAAAAVGGEPREDDLPAGRRLRGPKIDVYLSETLMCCIIYFWISYYYHCSYYVSYYYAPGGRAGRSRRASRRP